MLSRLLEEGQSSMNLSINFFARIMSNDSNLRRPNHREKKRLRVRQWKHPFSCRVFLFMLAVVDACSPEFTGESYMFNKQTNSTCSPQFRGESDMFVFCEVACSSR